MPRRERTGVLECGSLLPLCESASSACGAGRRWVYHSIRPTTASKLASATGREKAPALQNTKRRFHPPNHIFSSDSVSVVVSMLSSVL
jgi:hypothetical protein